MQMQNLMCRICANAGLNVSHLCQCRTKCTISVQMQNLMCRICAYAGPKCVASVLILNLMCHICANAGPNVSHLRKCQA